jgi:hypothetical protein
MAAAVCELNAFGADMISNTDLPMSLHSSTTTGPGAPERSFGNGASRNTPGTPRHIQAISDLMTDINAMRELILYYENRILRKQIAIEEIMHGKESRELDVIPDRGAITSATHDDFTRTPSVRQMLAGLLPEFNGTPFRYRDLQARAIQRYPGQTGRIQQGIGSACRQLCRRGDLIKLSRGMARVAPRQ